MRERIRKYEMMIVISPLQSNEEQVAETIERLRNTIEANNGEITSINHDHPWGRRKLAYPIRAYAGGEASRRNFTEGYYVLFHFAMSAEKVAEVERTIRLTDQIFRYLITIVEEPKKPRLDESEPITAEDGDLVDEEDEIDTDEEEENDEDSDDEDEDDDDEDDEDTDEDDEDNEDNSQEVEEPGNNR